MDFTRRLVAVRRARPARRFLPHTRPKEHPSMARHRPNVVELASRDRPAAHWKTEQPAGPTSFAAIFFAFPTACSATSIPSHPAGPLDNRHGIAGPGRDHKRESPRSPPGCADDRLLDCHGPSATISRLRQLSGLNVRSSHIDSVGQPRCGRANLPKDSARRNACNSATISTAGRAW